MQPVEHQLAETYRSHSDTEIASLYVQFDALTDLARATLDAEIQRRHLSTQQLLQLHTAELRQASKFDRRQKQHRQFVVSYFLRGYPKFRGDTKGTILTIALVLAVLMIIRLFTHHR